MRNSSSARRRVLIGAAAAACLALSGCQSGYRNASNDIVKNCTAGNLSAAAAAATLAATDEPVADDDGVAVHLEAGRMAQLVGDYQTSIDYYDGVYDKIRPYLDAAADVSVSEEFVSVLVNQTTSEYRATAPERIMLNTLQALNYLALGDVERAEIELRRAYDWQQDAVARNAEEIEELQEAGDAEAEKRGIDMEQVRAQPAVASAFASRYGDLEQLSGYADFVNPFTTYLQGVVALESGDRLDAEEARGHFQRVVDMTQGGAAKFAAEDLAVAESAAGGAAPPPTTWVFLLTGVAPARREFRLDIPIPLGNVNYVSRRRPADGAAQRCGLDRGQGLLGQADDDHREGDPEFGDQGARHVRGEEARRHARTDRRDRLPGGLHGGRSAHLAHTAQADPGRPCADPRGRRRTPRPTERSGPGIGDRDARGVALDRGVRFFAKARRPEYSRGRSRRWLQRGMRSTARWPE